MHTLQPTTPAPSRRLLAAGLLLLLLSAPLLGGLSWLEALLAPKAELWPRWQTHDANSTDRIDHRAWDAFLAAIVVPGADGINRVRYGTVTAGQRAALDGYLAAMQATPISAYNRAEQHAYWINLYNALTVRLILAHLPQESIRDLDSPWDQPLATVEGEALSLNAIEHRILRPIWRDPRTHYAVNCASLGCPNLQARAFTGATLNALLNLAAREYVNHPRGVRVDAGELVASSIYNWFEDDFGGSELAVIAHLRQYAAPGLAEQLSGLDSIADYAYDWSLNGAP